MREVLTELLTIGSCSPDLYVRGDVLYYHFRGNINFRHPLFLPQSKEFALRVIRQIV